MVTGIPGHPIQSKRNYCNLHLPIQRSTTTVRCLKILKAAYSTAGTTVNAHTKGEGSWEWGPKQESSVGGQAVLEETLWCEQLWETIPWGP